MSNRADDDETFQSAMSGFSAVTRSWFSSAFAAPTAAQVGAWDAIRSGHHTLVVAPTGSGKTLAAFMWSIDRLARTKADPVAPDLVDPTQRCRILYVSPMKALAADVERNLRSPLVGLRRAADLLDQPAPDITVAIRSGDTPPNERRRQAKYPSDILITTPESLFLLLTSQARETLTSISTVIIDEIHAVVGTKRGAHLALSLERLDAHLPRPAQRIGLSATVQPVSEVARFLGGVAPVTIVDPPTTKNIDLRVIVPVDDLGQLGGAANVLPDRHLPSADGDQLRAPSIWPDVEENIVDLIEAHTSTLVFANSRRLAERLTARLNEIHVERTTGVEQDLARSPAAIMAQSGATTGAPPVLAKAHHGSVSKEQRGIIEDDLKAGRLPAVVATSSLELGIDMGAIDLVIQVEAPPSVASGLQRVGRGGHSVGETSVGIVFPKHRGDLMTTAVVTDLMNRRQLEASRMPRNPLDVLAQHIVAMVSLDAWQTEELLSLVRRAAPFHALPESAFAAVLDMLAGRYPSDGFAQLRARIVWDRATGTLTGRPGGQRLAVTSGGTIPDRGLFGVFMVGEKASRVGELDEEMVYESRVGDVFALGASSWRIEEITHDRVIVSPAPGQAGRLPFWHGDALGRPAELGRAIGEFTRTVTTSTDAAARVLLDKRGLDARAADNVIRYVREQQEATGRVADDRTIVIERFRDELGDWRIVIHSPYGARVHAPWALAISDRVRDVTGVDAQVMHADDGIILRLPDTDDDAAVRAAVETLFPDPDEIDELVTRQITGSALFASRFRECAARALLLPRRDPGKRTPLWQQRQRSAALLTVAAQYPAFPIVLETVRECLQDVYDLPALRELLTSVRSREVDIVEVATAMPSPFARTLLFGYVATFLYEGDSPLAERRAAALTLDTELLGELLGFSELRELLDVAALEQVEAEVGCLSAERAARTAEHTADLMRVLGPLPERQWLRRGVKPAWIAQLEASRRVIRIRIAGEDRVGPVEDAGRLRDALGVALPVGIPDAFLEIVDDPIGDLVARFARTHGPFQAGDVGSHFGLAPAMVSATLDRLAAAGRLVSGEFRPGGSGIEWCDADVLRRIRRRSIAALRSELEAVSPAALGLFLPQWQHANGQLRGVDGVLRAIEQLAGASVPASALESLILPSRVMDYAPSMLDELSSSGEIVWAGCGQLSGGDGWLTVAPAALAPLVLPATTPDGLADPTGRAVIEVLSGGGAWLFRELSDRVTEANDQELLSSLWRLVWAGAVTTDTLAPLRAALAAGGFGRSPRSRASRHGGPGSSAATRAARLGRARAPSWSGPATASGRWSLVPAREGDPTLRLSALSQALLDRHGVVTRGAVAAEHVPGGFAAVYRVLSAFEDVGRVRRGYVVEGLGAAQFALPGAVDRLRMLARAADDDAGSGQRQPAVYLLAATDPASPFGAALAWPASHTEGGHRPGRKAGAAVVIVDGALTLYLERGGRSMLTFTDTRELLSAAAAELARETSAGRLGRLTIEKCDGLDVRTSPIGEILQDAGFGMTPRGMRIR